MVSTPDMLKITGINHRRWRIALENGHYRSAPVANGPMRDWTPDEMVAVAWFDSLCTAGMNRALAGGLVEKLTEAIARQPNASEFNVWVWKQNAEQGAITIGDKPEAPHAELIMVMPLAQWRANVHAAMASFYARHPNGSGRGSRRVG